MVTTRQWRKSTRSGSNNNCVEVAATTDQTLIRDSKLGDHSHQS
ncbi:DUF397 domain-containing protein [Fodinicola feengrottensis]|nr:DUF397 domain-containing protein [Fodinicola feengrottensis]